MRKVILYGELGRRFGKYHTLAVRNVAEAIRALRANFEGFEKFMVESRTGGMGFKVFAGHHAIGKYAEIHDPSGDRDTIRIVPILAGSKSPWFRVLIGAVLIATSFIIPGSQAFLVPIGASMIIGGVSQLLTKPPPAPTYSEPDRRESYLFNGPVNTSVQGSCVTVVYGRMMVGSKVISAGIETYEQ